MRNWVKLMSLAVLGCLLAACVTEAETKYGLFIDYKGRDTFRQPLSITNNTPFRKCSEFGSRVAVDGSRRRAPHAGIDLCGQSADVILAATNGTVKKVGDEYRTFEEDHALTICHQMTISEFLPSGEQNFSGRDTEQVCTYYGHLDEHYVEVGETVVRGQPIGSMGREGNSGDVIHLHFEVLISRHSNDYQDYRSMYSNPHIFWADGPGKMTCFDPKRTYDIDDGYITFPVQCSAGAVADAPEKSKPDGCRDPNFAAMMGDLCQ